MGMPDLLARLDLSGTGGEPFPYSQHAYANRLTVKSILGRSDQGVGLHGQKVTVAGWVKTGREQGKGAFAFLELNDGSTFSSLQVVVQSETYDISQVRFLSILLGKCTVASTSAILRSRVASGLGACILLLMRLFLFPQICSSLRTLCCYGLLLCAAGSFAFRVLSWFAIVTVSFFA